MFPGKAGDDICLFFRRHKHELSFGAEEYVIIVPSRGVASRIKKFLSSSVLSELSILITEDSISYINATDKSLVCKVNILVMPITVDLALLNKVGNDVVVIPDPWIAELDRLKEYVKWIIAKNRS